MRWTYRIKLPSGSKVRLPQSTTYQVIVDLFWYAFFGMTAMFCVWKLFRFWGGSISWNEIKIVVSLGTITLLRVLILIGLASVIWTPVGVYIGLRPRLRRVIQPLAQFLSAFPANLLFPLVVSLIITYGLNADVWLSPLMVLGTQWYILFNVIAGASAVASHRVV